MCLYRPGRIRDTAALIEPQGGKQVTVLTTEIAF